MEALLSNYFKDAADSLSDWALTPLAATKKMVSLCHIFPVNETRTYRDSTAQYLFTIKHRTMDGAMVWSHEMTATVYISVSRLL